MINDRKGQTETWNNLDTYRHTYKNTHKNTFKSIKQDNMKLYYSTTRKNVGEKQSDRCNCGIQTELHSAASRRWRAPPFIAYLRHFVICIHKITHYITTNITLDKIRYYVTDACKVCAQNLGSHKSYELWMMKATRICRIYGKRNLLMNLYFYNEFILKKQSSCLSIN